MTVNLTGKTQIIVKGNINLILFQSNACADHHVHQCLEQLAKDILRQDDRRLAYLQSPTSFH